MLDQGRPMGPFQKFWARILGREQAPPALPEVVVHDPEAAKPHDLDDPFFDGKIQERIGGAIAKATKSGP